MNFGVTAAIANGSVIRTINGDPVMNGADEWLPVSFDGGKGWVMSKYVTKPPSEVGQNDASVQQIDNSPRGLDRPVAGTTHHLGAIP